MKAIVVIDMPDEAKIEEYRITYVVYHLQGCGKGVQDAGAFLRPLPQKMVGKQEGYMSAYALGRNECVDEIVGK